jgi:4-hydroxybenzoate polyprenyltransferase
MLRRFPYLELIRPPNVATALADVLAGFAVGGLENGRALPWLLTATSCLYAGGITLNDVFDRDLDRRERPERPIPSGRVTTASASIFGASLLAAGTVAAFLAGRTAGSIALAIVGFVLVYDWWGKHRPVIGPLNMGLCRGLNVLLGMAAVPAAMRVSWPVAGIVVAYIAAVTLVSRGEVLGGARRVIAAALALLAGVLAALTALSATAPGSKIAGLALTGLLAWRVGPAFWRAWQQPAAGPIRHAVVTGVLSLVLVDAVIAAVYTGMIYCLALLATALLAGRLARSFAVT